VTLLTGSSLTLPPQIMETFQFWSTTTDLSRPFKPDCTIMSSLLTSMIVKSLQPVVACLICLAVFLASIAAAGLRRRPELLMDRNRLFNVFGSLLFTFFGAIASMALLVFKCAKNPNGTASLTVDLSVVCFESEWQSVLSVGVICVIVYIIGLGGLFVWVALMAPKRFSHPGFQMRWKFLIVKFHAGAYWWGIVFLTKNFLINLAFVISAKPVERLYIIMLVCSVYLSGISVILPYRTRLSNAFEAVVAWCIIYVTALMTWHTHEADGSSDEAMANITVGISFVPITLLPLLILRVIMLGKRIPAPECDRQSAEDAFVNIKSGFDALVALDLMTGTEAMLSMGDVELYWLGLAASVCHVELVGGSKRSRIAVSTFGTAVREQRSSATLPRRSRSTLSCNTLSNQGSAFQQDSVSLITKNSCVTITV